MAESSLIVNNMDLCILQLACMDRIQNLRNLVASAEARSEVARAGRLKHQLERLEDLLARMVQL
jgi:hypothetical protein